MERDEREKEGERKREELLVEKLKRGILVGKREGNSTPSPTWKFGLTQPDGTLIPEFNSFTKSDTLSARKLGANLWEMEAQLNLRVPKMTKTQSIFSHHKSEDKGNGIPKSFLKQETSGVNLRKQLAASMTQRNTRVEQDGLAQQPLSPTSYSSSMEVAPRRYAISPNSSLVSSNGKIGETSHSLKTSTELLKVLNRIWSLEEKHALDMSLVKTLRKELGQSQARVQELMQEKKRDQNELDRLMKHIPDYKVARKKEQEQERVKDAVKLVEEKLENEMKLRGHSEKNYNKLAKELLGIKYSFSNALRELERERKARVLLEDLCDEFAKGIRDCEQEIRLMKQKSGWDQIGREGDDRFILHISEAWLDERMQMKLSDARDVLGKHSALDKLCHEIESFLREKGSGSSAKHQDVSFKSPGESNVPSHSLESFHLNEPASAPWNAKDEDDSVGITNHCPQLCRGCSLKQVQHEEITTGDHDKETMKSRTENLNEMSNPRMPRKGETTQRSSREGKERVTDGGVGLEETKCRHDQYTCVEGSFDPSTFAGLSSPVKKWTSKVSVAGPDISEPSSRREKSMKPNTLKAKLMEARLEGQQSRTRTSRSLSQVD